MHKRLYTLRRMLAAVAMAAVVPTAASAAQCGDGAAGFDGWLAAFKTEAAKQGISANAINAGLAGVSYDANVVRLDRSQRSFKLSFEQFYARRVSPSLINRGRSLMQTHASTLARMEKQFGVPKEIVIAIWGLETNYGADSSGKHSIIRSLATLAYDCRRSAFFTGHLLDGLRIIQRGDMSAGDMRGGL
jgi:membrane-bound lytic murein transglycosylase B